MPATIARKLRLALPVAVLAIAALAPSTASAGPLVASAPDCSAQALSQPFLPFADVASYTPAPGGAFETGASKWTAGGASRADGNEPFFVTAANDHSGLTIPSGASATSPTICVGLGHPDIRFFAAGSSTLAQLNVEVLFEDATGSVQTLQIGAVTGSTDWGLSAPMPIVANLLPLLPNDMTPVAFRFSATGGSFRIDDVYVDPWRSY